MPLKLVGKALVKVCGFWGQEHTLGGDPAESAVFLECTQ